MIYNNIKKNGTHILIYYDDRKIYTNLEYNKFNYKKIYGKKYFLENRQK